MTDDELKTKVLNLMLARLRQMCNDPGVHSSAFPNEWERVLRRAGCESSPWSWRYPEDGEEHIFMRHDALGVIKVTRDSAMKILVLGIP